MIPWTIDNAGPDAMIIRFGDRIDPALVPVIRSATDQLRKALGRDIHDLVPSYTTLMVCYDPALNDFNTLRQRIKQHLSELEPGVEEVGRLVKIPVWYHSDVGPDLERVALHHHISIDDVIRRHTERDYRVFAIGFAPGFAYMGNVIDTLATPRLATPRQKVPAGSVALADQQTAVYPITTPGGWNLLGRTAVKMFDREQEGLCPVKTGDRVRFIPVSKQEFLQAGGTLE